MTRPLRVLWKGVSRNKLLTYIHDIIRGAHSALTHIQDAIQIADTAVNIIGAHYL
jgi:hypothetical protein